MKRTLLTILVTALVVGGGGYLWQQKTPSVVESEAIATKNTQESAAVTQKAASDMKEQTKSLPQFDTIDKYVALIMNESTGSQYKASKPAGFEKAKAGDMPLNIAPDGVSASVYVLAKSGWDFGSMDDVKTFYLEVDGPSPCWWKDECKEPNTVTVYGPFEGKLPRLLQ